MSRLFPVRYILSFLVGFVTIAVAMMVRADNAQHTFDANGRLYQVIGSNWTTTYTYDAAGNVTGITRTATVFTLVAITSRMVHGTTGSFDVPLDKSITTTNGNVSIEPRLMGASHTIVFQFNSPITNPGTAIAYDKAGAQIGSATTSASGNEVRVALAGTFDTKRVRIVLTGVNGTSTSYPIALGFLYGDVNGSRFVDAGDISAVRARSGQSINAGNAPYDIVPSNAIDGADVSAVRGRSGQALETDP